MKQLKFILFLVVLLIASVFGSCSKELDLDEETSVQIEKEAKIQRLQEIYDLSFEDGAAAATEYNRFFNEELITENHNFLSDIHIQQYNALAKQAVTMNVNFEKAKAGLPSASLFDLYQMKFKTDMINRSLLGEMPQLLKSGDNLEKFTARMNDINAFFERAVTDFKSAAAKDATIIDKSWKLSTFIFLSYPTLSVQNVSYDFILKNDNTVDATSFYLIPFIVRINSLESPWMEGQLNRELLLSPVAYTVYNDKICFYFRLKYNYDGLSKTGFTEREAFYEFDYQKDGNNLVLSKPRIGLYMYPSLNYIGAEMEAFDVRYLDAFNQVAFKEIILSAN